MLPELDGKDVVELGCGTAYVSAWLARRGARPVGVDITPAQLETARAMQREFGLEFPLIEADAAETGLPDGSADLVVSEYGASIWVDPVPLDPGGGAAAAAGRRARLPAQLDARDPLLARRGRAGRRAARPPAVRPAPPRLAGDGVEFHLAHGDWIRLLRDNGFEILDLVELQAPDSAETHEYYDFVSADWARKWPCRGDLAGAEAVSSHAVEPLLLASTSPQRRAILDQLGIPFDVVAPELRRARPTGGRCGRARARARARQGALGRGAGGTTAGARRRHRGLARRQGLRQAGERRRGGADARGARRRDARRRLRPLPPHARPGSSSSTTSTRVTFRELTPRELAHHMTHGEWEGRAGGYAIQGRGAALVEKIEGDYLNVVGLPAALLVRIARGALPRHLRLRVGAAERGVPGCGRAGGAAASG